MSWKLFVAPVGALLTLVAITGVAMADQGRGRSGDHDDALAAVEARQALPLTRIFEIAQTAVPGEIIEVELDREGGRLIYEVDILTSTGRLRQVEIDARTGDVLDVEDED
ncbi:MAG: PepSY domain-containing protein [Hyphomonadaceae bacterium]